MFTGVINNFAKIIKIQNLANNSEVAQSGSKSVACDDELQNIQITTEVLGNKIDVQIGQSISLNGICLTATKIVNNKLSFDISLETAKSTNISNWFIGQVIHIEQALKFDDRFDGHFVLGHIDTYLKVINNILLSNNNRILTISTKCLNEADKRLIIKKGSIAIDGISLTINEVDLTQFSLMLIPHTLQKTNLGKLQTGDKVNVEFDLLARYTQNKI